MGCLQKIPPPPSTVESSRWICILEVGNATYLPGRIPKLSFEAGCQHCSSSVGGTSHSPGAAANSTLPLRAMKTLFSKLQSHWWKPGKAGNLVSDLAFTFGKSKSEQQHVWLKTYKSTSHSLVPNLISLLQVPWHFPFPKQSICRAFQCICYPSGWAALLVVLPDCRQGTDPEGWRLLGAEGSAPKSSSGYKIPAKEQTDHWTCNTRQALASPGHHVTSTCILPQKKCSTFFYSENRGISEVNFYVFKPGALYFLGEKKSHPLYRRVR